MVAIYIVHMHVLSLILHCVCVCFMLDKQTKSPVSNGSSVAYFEVSSQPVN